MKRNISFAFILFFLCAAAFCRKNDFFLSIEPFLGSRSGEIAEILLQSAGHSYEKKSELIWPHAQSLYAGGKIAFGWKWLYADAYGAGFIPKPSGKMLDSDWLARDGVKHVFSINDNFINFSSFFAGGTLGLSIPLLSALEITPSVSFDYEYLLFNAKDGFGWYGDAGHSKTGTNVPWNSSDAAFIPSGGLFGISYDRRTVCTWLGVSIRAAASPKLEFGFGVFTSPFVLAESIDHHEDRGAGAFYYDRMSGFFRAGKADFYIAFNINRTFGIKTSLAVTELHRIDGGTFLNNKGKFADYYSLRGYRAATEARYLDMGISFIYTPLSRTRTGLLRCRMR